MSLHRRNLERERCFLTEPPNQRRRGDDREIKWKELLGKLSKVIK